MYVKSIHYRLGRWIRPDGRRIARGGRTPGGIARPQHTTGKRGIRCRARRRHRRGRRSQFHRRLPRCRETGQCTGRLRCHHSQCRHRLSRDFPRRASTADGLPSVFAVNSLAPYILTCLITRPARPLIYLSSGLHRQGDESLEDLAWKERPWSGYNAYADSKLHDVILAFAVARKWKDVLSNSVEPGWVATKMCGEGAPDSLEEGPRTQAWLWPSARIPPH